MSFYSNNSSYIIYSKFKINNPENLSGFLFEIYHSKLLYLVKIFNYEKNNFIIYDFIIN